MIPDCLTPYGNRPMVAPIVNAVDYEYPSFEVLRQITDGEINGYTYHREDNRTVRQVERKIALLAGMSVCTVPGGPCMGPIFGRMLFPGKRVAKLVRSTLPKDN